jgi:uncharacterized protein (TIRG00374 family)
VRKFFSLRVWLGFLIGVFFLYLAFWKPDISGLFHGRVGPIQALIGSARIRIPELIQVLAHARYLYLLPALVMFLASFYVRAYRWKLFLLPVGNVRFGSSFSSMMIGYMVNNILPLRMGELFRAYSIGQAEKISKSSAFATVVVERLFDILCLLLILGIIFLFFPFPSWIRQSSLITLAGTVILVAMLVFLIFKTELAVKINVKVFGVLGKRIAEKIEHITRQFTRGLDIFKRTEHYFIIIVASLILWVFYAACVYCVLYTFDFVSPEFPLIQHSPIMISLVILAVGTIAIIIPSTPGAVGTYHGVVVLGLSLFGVPAEQAMGFALVNHLLNYLPLTLIGLYCYWRHNLHLSEIQAQEDLEPVSVSQDQGRSI